MDNTVTVDDIRKQLGQFLTKPVAVTTGTLSTQQDVSATSVNAGGIQGEWSMGRNGVIISTDANRTRAKFGKLDDNGRYGLEVYDQNGNVLFNEQKIKIEYAFSTFMENSNVNWTAIVGFMNYNSTAGAERNVTTRLDFVKPANFTITDATVYYKFQDLLQFGTTNRLADVDIFLNPTKTKVSPGSSMDYYRFSGGDTVKSNIDPNADEYIGSEVFTATEISHIANGLNYIVAQQSTSSDTAMGFCVLSLVLTGYLNP